MQTWIRYVMRPRKPLKMVFNCQTTSEMCSRSQTWRSLAIANVCRGWCTCAKPGQCKKGVAPGRCESPTCAHVNLHHPTHVQKWLHSLLEGMNVNRGMHIRLYTHACATAMPKMCVDWGVVCLWMSSPLKLNWLSLCFLKFALLKIRCHASPYRKHDDGMKTETPGCPNFD